MSVQSISQKSSLISMPRIRLKSRSKRASKREPAAPDQCGCQHGGTVHGQQRNRPEPRSGNDRGGGGSGSPPLRRPAGRLRFLQSEQGQGLALISPTFLYALVLLAVPILVVIAYQLLDAALPRRSTGPSRCENYRVALTEPIYRDLLCALAVDLAAGQHRHRHPRLSDRLFHLLPRRHATRSCGCSSSPSRSGPAICCASCPGR